MSTYSFILYVAGNLPNSVQAISNLKAICADLLPNDFRLEVVDVMREPQRGLRDGILLTPTLMKLEPAPKQIILGNLSDASSVLNAIRSNGRTEVKKTKDPKKKPRKSLPVERRQDFGD